MDDFVSGTAKDATTPQQIAVSAKTAMGFSHRFLKHHGWKALFWFVSLLVPLWAFGALADQLNDGQVFPFDSPILRSLHALANAGLDRLFVVASGLGYVWGVVPMDAVLVIGLALRRHGRESVFAGFSIVGSLLLNLAAKHSFARTRPGLWVSIVHENSFSFPSGHAMGSMTLAMALVMLCWYRRSRWGWSLRWPITLLAAVFVLLVGLSRVYLGVHYPSDILAGWAAAAVWVLGIYGLVFHGTLKPWQAKKDRIDPIIQT